MTVLTHSAPAIETEMSIVMMYGIDQVNSYESNCGYNDIVFDTSLNTLLPGDIVAFAPGVNSTTDSPICNEYGVCKYTMATYPSSDFGFVDFRVKYFFTQFKDDTPQVSITWMYNSSFDFLLGTMPCNDITHKYTMAIDKCMFSEKMYTHRFFDVYKFIINVYCDLSTPSLFVDLVADTCVNGTFGGNCNEWNTSNMTLVSY
jgi:hypothetical protein